jgi:D-hexose-6-phosphate mutarotase
MPEATAGGLLPPDQDRRVFDKLQIESERTKVGINPDGGYITSWQVKNPQGDFENILDVAKTIRRTGIPTLFPYYGEGGDKGPNHGFGRNSMWTIDAEKSTGNKVVMRLSSKQISPEAREKYPYPFAASITVEVEEDGSLIYNLHVENTGNEDLPLPLSPGLHPYFEIANNDKSKMSIDGIPEFNAAIVNWDKNPPDKLYDYAGKTTVHVPGRAITIEDISDKPVIKYLNVWSEILGGSVCVEPLCGKDNAINEDPILVTQGNAFDMRIRFSASFDQAA